MTLDAYDTIFENFKAATASDWKNKIIKDLKDVPFDNLIVHTNEGFDILPFYTKEDNQKYQLAIPAKTTTAWQIAERIIVHDVKVSNAESLLSLQNGANAIVFNLQNKSFSLEEINQLLHDIQVDIVTITFEDFQIDNKTILESKVANSCAVKIYVEDNSSIVAQLVNALQQAETINSHCFHFYVGKNYFFEIAKIRAFRWLWKQLCELRNEPNQLFIQCETSLEYIDAADEYTNMLRNTTAAMSAIIGGCDGLLINSHDCKSTHTIFGKRIARNIHHILQYESYFNELNDAAKGSYYIEYLTYQFCKESWNKYNHK